jgi:hypothetical protein
LLVVTEAQRPERFYWIWPLQAITLAALAFYVFKRLEFSWPIQFATALLMLAIVAGTESKADRLRAWSREGWSGADSDEMQAVAHVAGRLQGQREAKIGYEISFLRFLPDLHDVDARYKVGAEMDLLFYHRYHLLNTDRCGEGIAPDDRFRIVDLKPPVSPLTTRFNVPPDSAFTPVHDVGRLRIVERLGSAPAP